MFTCIECGFDYDSRTGDTDERMCHECMRKFDMKPIDKLEDDLIEAGLTHQQLADTLKAISNYVGAV